jgi:GntR family transcriptional regulator / MocR family aminotransferase
MRTSSSLDLLLRLDRAAPEPLRAQLEDQLREAVRAGRLAPGTALPSTRALARELGVSRGVVVDAFAQLAAEGWLSARQGAPTRVAAAARPPSAEAGPPHAERPPRFDFRPGGPDVSLFPRAAWLASLRRALKTAPDARLDYGDPRGAPELRHALASYLGRVRGVACDPARIVVTSGMAQGFALIGRTVVAAGGRRIGVEEPGSGPGREQLAATGLEPVPVPVDGDGLVTAGLDGARLDALLVTPAHQFPTGAVLAPDRRAELLGWVARSGAVLVEDDYDAEYRYDRQPVGAVQGLDPDRVVYAGSLSKTLAPGLRLGWLAPPDELAEPLTRAKAQDDLGTPVMDQLALADFLERGELDRHLRRTRGEYRRRRDALVSALAAHVPEARVTGVAAGIHLVAHLPEAVDEPAVLAAARARGVGLQGLSEHRMGDGAPALILGYGRIAEPAIAPGIRALAAAIRSPRSSEGEGG